MVKETEVEEFLSALKAKLLIWDVAYRVDRLKNQQTLLALEITQASIKNILSDLTLTDYAQGPLPDTLYKGPDMWVFGKWIKEREVYIKITIGQPSLPVICISFHLAEHPMNYPFKS